jgi:PAS domain S-box-containing protein
VEPAERAPGELTDALLASVVDAAPDGIVVVDGAGVIEFVNAMGARMFGFGVDELVGRHVEVLLPERMRAMHVPEREGYVGHPRTRAMGSGLDLHGLRRSGEEFPVEIALSPVRAGASTHVIAIVRDVTERRAAAAELAQAHEQLALVDERERIARDLHDTVIQRLFAVGLSLQGAHAGCTEPKLAGRLETAIDEIDGTIRDIRTAIFSLHARRMTSQGIRDDVLATAREAGRALGFEPQVSFDGPIDASTSDDMRAQLVPVLREVLSNIVKHAKADSVAISLRADNGEIVLCVVDDGVGIDAEHAHGGRGLGNIMERATALGGACTLNTPTGGGTLIEWRVPATRA